MESVRVVLGLETAGALLSVGGREELGSAASRGREEGGTKLVGHGSLEKSVKLSVLF
jgi:hypothetical protein